MIVKVCDAICGAGKTQSCISMINSSTDKKFIFITPYLDEVERIKTSCKSRNFISPERKFSNNYSKLEDIHDLLREGVNIASTHALFSSYTDETKELIKQNNYTLVLDEVIDLFQPVEMDSGDIHLLVKNKIAKKENDNVIWDDDSYDGVLFNDVMNMSKSKNLVDYDGSFYFWSIPADVFKSFEDVYVLTYLFEYQMLKYFFDVNDIQYKLIGTKKVKNEYNFCPLEDMDRKIDLLDKIHILNNPKYNEIGNKSYTLSAKWFERAAKEKGQPKLVVLKNNLYNVFRHSNCEKEDKMWTTLNKYRSYLKGKGYSNGFITFNKRATNDFADRHYLAYCVNVFMQPWVKNYLVKIGSPEINQDMYAVSVLIQWIFRSAIRKGEEVWIYIPSKRMRFLLTEWLKNLSEGNDLKEINFINKKTSIYKETAYAVKEKNKRGKNE